MGAQGEKERRGQGAGWGEKGRKRKPRGSYAGLNPPRFGKFEPYPEACGELVSREQGGKGTALWPHRAREAVAGKGVRGEVAPGPRARSRKGRWTDKWTGTSPR